jgi:hypothetical protein
MTMLKVIEVLAESDKGWEDAAQIAVAKANKSVRNVRSTGSRISKPRSITARSRNTESTARFRSCSRISRRDGKVSQP